MKKLEEHIIDEAVLRLDYDKSLSELRELEQEAVFTLRKALKNRKLKIHSLTHRVKEFPSFIDKCKRIKLANPVRDMQDMVGLRVVCLYLSDIERVRETVTEVFDFLREADLIRGADVSSFGYMSHHVIVQMKSSYKGPRYDTLAGRPFEVQIRTILMDAWANVSHHLQYKTESDVPKSLLRDFHALSGLFYVADTHFEMFFKATQESRAKMADLFRRTEPREIQEEVNLDSLRAYLRNKFPDRRHDFSPGDLSELVTELKGDGYQTIAQIDSIYEQAHHLVLEAEHHEKTMMLEQFKNNLNLLPEDLREVLEDKSGLYFGPIGMVRIAFLIASETFANTAVNSWEISPEGKAESLSKYQEYRKRLVRPLS